jgi:[ribosomal protein S5]-alanine N-acetyltransferase
MIVFETERLLFRQLTIEDTDDLATLYSDLEVMRFFEGMRTRQQAYEEIEECLQWYDRLGFYFWATIHKADNRFIGRCGLLPQVIDDQQEYEVAYMLARSYWNQGLGTEAARAIKEYGFREYRFPRLISLIAPGNLASMRVAEKNGMRYVKDVPFEGYIDRLYAIDREP